MHVNSSYTLIAILVMGAVTFGIRVSPFILFGKRKTTPKCVVYIGKYLPPAVMVMLIIYCLRNIKLYSFPFGIPEAIGIITVAALHVWKHNNLLSIIGGTIVYMVEVQLIFL
ncbi:MAG: AzlD domain-containing protein [Clostridium sp.]|nr:AzlD domain-containing protein [Clostridium sp.]